MSVFSLQASANCPTGYHFSHIKSGNGLPHQQVQAMAFDHIGRLWIGTRNGLACYDGYTFATYYHIPDDPTSLCHNFVIELLVDSDNRLWIGTEKGICRYCPDTDSFKSYDVGGERIFRIVETGEGDIFCGGSNLRKLDPANGVFQKMPRQEEGDIVGLAVSPDNRVFVATSRSISWYDKDIQKATFLSSSIFSDFLTGLDDIVPLFFDREGRLWIGRNGKGVMSLDLSSGKTVVYDVSKLTNGTVRTIAEDAEGNIWLGTEGGLNKIDPATGNVDGFMQDLVNYYKLNDNAIYCIVPDSHDNLWIGTYFGGINLLRKNYSRFHWTAPGYDEMSVRGKAIRRIIEPVNGTLWLATEDSGVNIMDLKTHRISVFDKVPGLGTNVHELYDDKENGLIWMGTFRNGLFWYNTATGASRQYLAGASGLGSEAIFSIVGQRRQDGSTRLWIGTTQGLRYYNRAEDCFVAMQHPVLDVDFIYCMIVDHKENIWVGTHAHGLFRIDAVTGEVQGWDIAANAASDGLRDCYITSICEDSHGRLFVGTNNGGLHYMDMSTMTLHHISDDSTEFGTICNIIDDGKGHVWISTSNGLFRMDPTTLHAFQFTIADGLPENQFNFASALMASDGNLHFGTVNGLVSFSPDIEKLPGKPKDVHLLELLVNNRTISAGMPESPLSGTLDETLVLKLDYDDSRSFSIAYGVVDPASASSVVYQVMVDGIDKSWRDVGSLRNFTAMDLAPGTYKLRIRAASGPEGWSDAPVRELVIRIAPPFWLSVWAFIVYFVLLLVVAYVFYRFAKVRISEKNAIRMSRMEKDKSDELNREKMEFFTNISHELKTPLSLILAPLKYISQNQSLTEESSKRLSLAIANTNKMVGLVDELVTFNRVESGNFQLYLQQGNPLTFTETITHSFYEAAQEKNITIHVYTENNGESVWFSTTYLERIINNLLSNAIKYTNEGGEISVRASIEEGVDNNIYLVLEVRDNGIGIAPEELDNIFRKYYQTKRGYNTNHSGWGIGLATVKKLVERHKGSITVESEMGVGSQFTVRLNVTRDAFDASCCITSGANASPEPSYRRAVSAVAASPSLPDYARKADRTSVLIVEDNVELLNFLTESFSSAYNVYTATNGKEALRITSECPIDIVVSDVMMPEMDGITLCEHLKNDLATSHIPVILLTAKNDEDSIMRGYEAGAEAYVAKPFDPQILELRVKNILRARSKFLKSIIESTGATAPVFSVPAGGEAAEDTPTFNTFDKDFITRINALVEANLDNSEFAIADITREFGISRSLLHIKMKSFFNTSMSDFIRTKRLAAACRLLKEGYNVSETAYRTGYSDPNYFTKVFKKEFGLTPTEYLASPTSAVPPGQNQS